MQTLHSFAKIFRKVFEKHVAYEIVLDATNPTNVIYIKLVWFGTDNFPLSAFFIPNNITKDLNV